MHKDSKFNLDIFIRFFSFLVLCYNTRISLCQKYNQLCSYNNNNNLNIVKYWHDVILVSFFYSVWVIDGWRCKPISPHPSPAKAQLTHYKKRVCECVAKRWLEFVRGFKSDVHFKLCRWMPRLGFLYETVAYVAAFFQRNREGNLEIILKGIFPFRFDIKLLQMDLHI